MIRAAGSLRPGIRLVTGAAVALALCLGLAACESTTPIPTPSPAAVIGSWRHGSDVLTLDPDGTFTVSAIPEGVVAQAGVARGAAPVGPNVAISGTWSIGSGGTDAGGAPGVQLEFDQPRKVGLDYGLTLIVAGTSPQQLYVNLGHPEAGIRYSFTKR